VEWSWRRRERTLQLLVWKAFALDSLSHTRRDVEF
jgi:hypothetical protein